MQLAFEDSSFTLEVFCMVFFGEGDVYVEFFTDLLADDLFFEAGNELAAAKLQIVFFGFATVECNAVK